MSPLTANKHKYMPTDCFQRAKQNHDIETTAANEDYSSPICF